MNLKVNSHDLRVELGHSMAELARAADRAAAAKGTSRKAVLKAACSKNFSTPAEAALRQKAVRVRQAVEALGEALGQKLGLDEAIAHIGARAAKAIAEQPLDAPDLAGAREAFLSTHGKPTFMFPYRLELGPAQAVIHHALSPTWTEPLAIPPGLRLELVAHEPNVIDLPGAHGKFEANLGAIQVTDKDQLAFSRGQPSLGVEPAWSAFIHPLELPLDHGKKSDGALFQVDLLVRGSGGELRGSESTCRGSIQAALDYLAGRRR